MKMKVNYIFVVSDGGLVLSEYAKHEISTLYNQYLRVFIECKHEFTNPHNEVFGSSLPDTTIGYETGIALFVYRGADGWEYQDVLFSTLLEASEKCLLVQRLSVAEFDPLRYLASLAFLEKNSAHQVAELKKKYDILIQDNFTVPEGLSNIFEPFTGGVIFRDYEWYEIDNNNELKRLFSAKYRNGSYKHLLNLDFNVMLRGPDVYYYFSCYTSRLDYIKKTEYEQWVLNCISFLDNVIIALDNYSIKSSYDARLLIAVIDNMRNLILMMMNTAAFSYIHGQSAVASILSGATKEISIWVELTESVIDLFLEACIHPYNSDLINNTNQLVKKVRIEIEPMLQRIWPYKNYLVFYKCFNPFREADNFFENYIALEYAIEKLETNGQLMGKDISLICILSGAIELPFIMKKIGFSYKSLDISIAFQNNGMYLDKQIKSIDVTHDDFKNSDSDFYVRKHNILVDENIMSGVTMQLMINELATIGCRIHNVVSIRHPNINRLAQTNHFKINVNPTLLSGYIYGMLFDTPYTKIPENTNYGGMFTDALDIFSLTSEIVLKAIYKNGSFIKDSEADIFHGHITPKEVYEL